MKVVLVSSDMMVSSRLRSAAEQASVALAIALSPADLTRQLEADVRLVIFDLSQPGLMIADAVAAVRNAVPGARIIAFGPHVDSELLAAAEAAGCDAVMTNGQFHREQGAILSQCCQQAG